MASQPLRLDDEGLRLLCERQGLSQVGDVLSLGCLDLCEILGTSEARGTALRTSAAIQAAPQPVTAAQLYQASQAAAALRVPTGLPGLDAALRGGLPLGAITEVVGPSGVGKTQLCMGAVINAAAPRPWGLQKVVVYIDTERKFNSARLIGMARARLCGDVPAPGPGHPAGHPPMSEADLSGLMERVLLQHPTDADNLMWTLHSLSGMVSGQAQGVALVVLDSVAALVRGAGDHSAGSKAVMRSRAELLGQAAGTLKTVAEAHRLPVLVTNQVKARMDNAVVGHNIQSAAAGGARAGGAGDGEGGLSAALGTAWAHSVNVRLQLDRRGDNRVLQLTKSPASCNVAMECSITSLGLQQLAGTPTWQPVQGSVLDANIVNQRMDDTYDQALEGAPNQHTGY